MTVQPPKVQGSVVEPVDPDGAELNPDQPAHATTNALAIAAVIFSTFAFFGFGFMGYQVVELQQTVQNKQEAIRALQQTLQERDATPMFSNPVIHDAPQSTESADL